MFLFRILVCDLNKGCGFGCQLHHVGYCLSVAAASNRTMVLEKDGEGWRYSKHGWGAVFKSISSCTFANAVPVSYEQTKLRRLNSTLISSYYNISLILKP